MRSHNLLTVYLKFFKKKFLKLILGVAFKKTFSYAGFEMQKKKYEKPMIALLNVELELKAEKENAEVRVTNVKDYQKVVDAEWEILYEKLEACHKSGANVSNYLRWQ